VSPLERAKINLWTRSRPPVILILALSKGPNRVGVSLPSPEDGDRSSFRNVVFPIYLELWTMGKVHKSSDSECYTQSSEPFNSTTYESVDNIMGKTGLIDNPMSL
jgi:hypothetical protein